MCFNVSVSKDIKQLEKKFNAKASKGNNFISIFSVNAFGFNKLPIITNATQNVIDFFHWGLVPSWVTNEKKANDIRSYNINAVSETLHKKPSFRGSYKNKRCLVLVDGFYEYHKINSAKIPYYIKFQNHEAFALAGLWDIWTNSESNNVYKSFTIVTTKANSLLEKVHNSKKRMPVILNSENQNIWLNSDNETLLNNCFIPFEDSKLIAYEVSNKLSKLGLNTTNSFIQQPTLAQSFFDFN